MDVASFVEKNLSMILQLLYVSLVILKIRNLEGIFSERSATSVERKILEFLIHYHCVRIVIIKNKSFF
jgi:hypothetical protein